MEQAIQELKNYSRWLCLEAKLPRLEETLEEAKDLRIEADGRVRLAQWEMDRLEKPGFFLRLKGNLEEQKEEVYREYRAVQGQLEAAQQEVNLRKKELEDARAEYAALADSWQAYLEAKAGCPGTAEEEQRLLAGICAGLTKDCQDALEQARNWMRTDVLRTGVSPQNRKMEFLALAAEKAGRINAILDQLPEGLLDRPSYLRSPEGYITGVTMEYKQLDRVNQSIEQIWELRQKLKNL